MAAPVSGTGMVWPVWGAATVRVGCAAVKRIDAETMSPLSSVAARAVAVCMPPAASVMGMASPSADVVPLSPVSKSMRQEPVYSTAGAETHSHFGLSRPTFSQLQRIPLSALMVTVNCWPTFTGVGSAPAMTTLAARS
jgi:hypothetical protein